MISDSSSTLDQPSAPDTILLVDDDPFILEGVGDLLTLSGYDVILADDGSTALPLLEHHHPHLIISDLRMRVMDGYEFCDAVRSNPNWAAIPFIFLTAHGESRDVQIGHSKGADAYITKPFNPDYLVTIVKSRLQRVREIESYTQSEVERMKQQLMTIFSHELRTPLTYVYGYISLLEDHAMLSPDEIDMMVGRVRRGAERLLKLIEDLTLMIRVDSGVAETEVIQKRRPCDLKALIFETVGDYQEEAAEAGIRLTIEAADALVAPVMQTYVRDALGRLISNAIKFSKGRGGDVVVSLYRDGEMAAISVQDHGIGIRRGEQESIFQRFNQLNREEMEQQGIGLGLTISRSLIRLHGGNIVVRSAPGEGSTFTVTLPLQAPVMSYVPNADQHRDENSSPLGSRIPG